MRRTALLFALAGLVGALVATPIVVYASHQFTDVDDSHIFHGAIGWLADSGITEGCNPPAATQYCPDANVTRGQMAAFLKRLAEKRVVDAATAVFADNADKLDGLDSSDFLGATGQAVDSDKLDGLDSTAFDTFIVSDETKSADQGPIGATSGTTPFELAETTFNVPVDAFAAVTASTSFSGVAGGSSVVAWLQVDNGDCFDFIVAPGAGWSEASSAGASDPDEVTVTSVVALSAGPHTLTSCFQALAGTASIDAAGIFGIISASPNNDVTITIIPA